jgi:sugar lactone lactonase YvrE
MNAQRKNAPVMKWHPETGKSKVFDHPDDVPAGYVSEHPNNLEPADRKAAIAKLKAEKKAGKVEKAEPLTRKEIIAALTDGGLPFDGNAETVDLDKALSDALKEHLQAAEVLYPSDADTRELLTLVPKPE